MPRAPASHAPQAPQLPALGAGVGLRSDYFDEILDRQPPVRWFEVIPENFLHRGGRLRRVLSQLAERYRLVAHGVGLSIGSTDPLDLDHVRALRAFCDDIQSPWFSDHLCFTVVDHVNLNELMPLPFTRETVKHLTPRIHKVQEELARPFLLENVTYYAAPARDEMTEAQFISEIIEATGCGLLLDVANVVLNARNHAGYSPTDFFDAIPMHRVGQMHLAGHEPYMGVMLDTHAAPVSDETWEAFRQAVLRTGPTSVLIERDAQLPTLDALVEEAEHAQRIMEEAMGSAPTPSN